MITGKTRLLCLPLLVASLIACQNDDAQDQQRATTSAGSVDSTGRLETLPPRKDQSVSVAKASVTAGEILSSKHSSLHALSADEARWLQRHGYPTAAEMEHLHSFDVDQLENALRNRKDIKAGALLGHRLLLDGDIAGSSSAFAASAALGSLYARQQLAMVSTMDVTGLPMDRLAEADQGNLAVMVAQLEMARLLGDHRAQAYIDRYGARFDWKHYGRHVLTQTAEFMRQYGEFARATGRRPIGPDPRPNPELWERLGSDPYASVTVYERPPGGF